MAAPNTLSARTTLRVGGAARGWIVADTDEQAITAIVSCDASGTPVLILGGGSNMLVADAGFDGTVVEMATRGFEESVGDEAVITVKAGESWDSLVAMTVQRGWSGIEALSGIPGLAGATPIQNVGAYGQDIGQVVSRVRALDRSTGAVRTLDHGACAFGYRSSVFKQEPTRWVVLDVTLHLSTSRRSVVRYAELARSLGVQVGHEADVDRSGAQCSSCVVARGWCSTRQIRTPGAPAPSSPILSSVLTWPRECLRSARGIRRMPA